MKIHEGTRVPRRRRLGRGATATVGAVTALSMVMLAFVTGALAAQPPVNLGTADSYAVLAGSTVTNTGPTVLSGDLGLSPGSAVTGFPPGLVTGNVNVANAAAVQAQTDLTIAYLDVEGRGPVTETISADLGGRTLTPGVYNSASSMALTGALTLDAEGDSSAVFIFQAGSTLTTATASQVNLLNGASPCNVFWQVGSSATLLATTSFKGTILALTSITLVTGATVDGRLLARNGAVTLDSNLVNAQACSQPPVRTPTTTVTQVHNPSHADITNGSVVVGTAVHDSATVTGASPSGTVTYHFYATGQGTCLGASIDETVAVGTESSPLTLAVGSYAYSADYNGDANNLPSTGVCEPFRIAADNTPPICPPVPRIGTDSLGRKFIEVDVQDSGSGLASVTVDRSTNANTVVPAFTPGTNDLIVVRATKILSSKSSSVQITVRDVAGNSSTCDPLITELFNKRGQRVQVHRGLPQAESKISIENGSPGIRYVEFVVNGRKYVLSRMRAGQTYRFSVAKAMKPGSKNKIVIRMRGRLGGSALVVISD